MASTASSAPHIKDKPSAIRHFFDRPPSINHGIHLSRSASGSRRKTSSQISQTSSRVTSQSGIQNINQQVIKSNGTTAGLGISNHHGVNRSSSLRGPRAPAVELNAASLCHVQQLLRQLLNQVKFLTPTMVSQWEKALHPILLQATDDLDPDVHQGDDIDVRSYVKIKRILGATPDDSVYLSGVVFTKNVALKSMPREINSPRVMLLSFPLDFGQTQLNPSKVSALSFVSMSTGGKHFVNDSGDLITGAGSKLRGGLYKKPVHHFMSLDQSVISQEKERLERTVRAIVARRPQVLLTAHNISGYALEELDKCGIAVLYNVRPKVLTAVARATQAEIVNSAEVLLRDLESNETSSLVKVGSCGHFEIKTYTFNGNMKKTFASFSGCPPSLRCTIVLRGGDMNTLLQIKIITQFMIYMVYNLKLETCLMRDEFVFMPSPAIQDQAQSNGLAKWKQKALQTGSDEMQDLVPASGKLNDAAISDYYDALAKLYNERIVSTSPFVDVPQPYLLLKARQAEKRLQKLEKITRILNGKTDFTIPPVILNSEKALTIENADHLIDNSIREKDSQGQDEEINVVQFPGHSDASTITSVDSDIAEIPTSPLDLVRPELLDQLPGGGERLMDQVRRGILELECDSQEYISALQKYRWEQYFAQTEDYLFDPFAYQHLTILYSLICEITTAPCTGPDLVSINYYHDGDSTLGQFIEGICESADMHCSDGCSYLLSQHYRSYVHGNGRINVRLLKTPCRIPGMESTILMWSHCNICGSTIPAIPMSENTWKYSFGKYLELSFWSAPLSLRADVCPHDIHKDHVRVFSLHGLEVRFEYVPIELLDISFPRTRLIWKPEIDVRLKADEYSSIQERTQKFFDSVVSRLNSVKVEEFSSAEKSDECRNRIEMLRDRAFSEQEDLLDMLQTIYVESSYREYLPLNAVIRSLQERVVQWDLEFADFDRSFFPSEKDIARLTAIQLKKIFVERDTSAGPLGIEDQAEIGSSSDLGSAVELMPVMTADLPSSSERGSSSEIAYAAESHDSSANSAEIYMEQSLRGFPSSGFSSSVKAELQTSTHGPRVNSPLTQVSNLDETVAESDDRESSSATSSSDNSGLAPMTTTSDTSSVVTEATLSDALMTNSTEDSSTSSPIITADNGLSLTRSQSSSRSLSSRRKIAPDRLVLPPLGQLKSASRFTQGTTTRELARQLQLSRSGTDVHGPPMSVAGNGDGTEVGQSKVISLARHFDQLSREFEKERARERKKLSQSRLRAIGSSKPIVEVYRNIEEAVVEEDDDDDSGLSDDGLNSDEDLFLDAGSIGRRSRVKRTGSELRRSGKDKKPESREDVTTLFSADSQTSLNSSSISTIRNAALTNLKDSTSPTQAVLSPGITSPPPSSYFESSHSISERIVSGSSANYDASKASTDYPVTAELKADESGEDSVAQSAAQEEGQSSSLHSSVAQTPEQPYQPELSTPGPEKISLMAMLSNFWADRSASGWRPLEYPLQPSEHIFVDSDVIVREDEPSSLIAVCLSTPDYLDKLHQIRRSDDPEYDSSSSEDDVEPVLTSQPNKEYFTRQKSDAASSSDPRPKSREELRKWLLKETGTHLKYQFREGSAKLSCKIFYAELFDAFRTLCGCEERYIQSLSRCVKWDSTGGKSGSAFLKTLDDRLVVKQLSPSELDAFIKFAPSYFEYMSKVFFDDLPSVIAKIMGFYQVQVRNPITNKTVKMDILVMENLFYDRSLSRIFDLKGSMRNRHVEQTGRANEVLLDENMVEYIFESPLFVREPAKNILRASLWNDTLFLSKMNVMDYSLVIAIDADRQQLVVGIIDCLRTFTWDKKLESWVKEKGLVGGGGKVPTIVTPKQYKARFRAAMERYVLMVPDFWHQLSATDSS
ncbi:uncharacterized protein V1516DRAFT_713137 [Lipomyces oligophaga]|uniref:uncharacterized protein n=1 Tax=Lipomyces oligophaga TaxID=45792 RepID=UPI0034CF2E17